jgi:hypothetical protein
VKAKGQKEEAQVSELKGEEEVVAAQRGLTFAFSAN